MGPADEVGFTPKKPRNHLIGAIIAVRDKDVAVHKVNLKLIVGTKFAGLQVRVREVLQATVAQVDETSETNHGMPTSVGLTGGN
jgi:hypothetical protein